jgi:hypothetical protein
MPLTQDRLTSQRTGKNFGDPVAAGAVIFAGSLVCLDASGNAVPGVTATDLTARGMAEEHVDNSAGVAGAVRVRVVRGVFCFDNSAGADQVTRADIGSQAWIVDDHTVAATNGTNTRSPAGIIRDVDSQGVWIEI